jgi:hypothetical protein
MAKIRIEYNGLTDEIEFETRSNVKLVSFQNFLKKAHDNNAEVECLCTDGPNYPLVTVAKYTNYTVKRNHHHLHSQECLFHSERESFYNQENERYKKSIFEEPKGNQNNGGYYVEDTEYEKVRRYTYRHFCIDVFSEAISYAFSLKNKELVNLEMYSSVDYFSCLTSKIYNKRMADGKSPYESLANYYKLSHGIIYENLDSIDNNIINLSEFIKKDNNFVTKEAKISDQRLEITKNLQNNMGNTLNGPYAYIAVYRMCLDKNKNKYNEIVRLYTYAIEILDDRFSFVESGLERKYAITLLENNIAFIKPVNGHEYETVGDKYYPNGRPDLKYRPDFIEFSSDSVKVVEVCGYPNDINYMNELRRKEDHYKKHQDDGLINYVRVGC